MTDVGHGVFQFAPEHVILPGQEWSWMRELARDTGRTVSVNFNQTDQAPDLWREVLDKLDEARSPTTFRSWPRCTAAPWAC